MIPRPLALLQGVLQKLPGVGAATATRFAVFLLKNTDVIVEIAQALASLADLKTCKTCGTYSEQETCLICSSPNRIESVICVVEGIKEVLAIEKTQAFKGCYHTLNGLISPMEGVSPSHINIDSLLERCIEYKSQNKDNAGMEVILALGSKIEAKATELYIMKLLGSSDIKVTRLSYGIAVGVDLETVDAVTLATAIDQRVSF